MYVLEKAVDYFLIKTHWSFLKYKDLLNRLNIFKISTKEHQAVHFWVTGEIRVSETLFSKHLEYDSQI